MTKVSKRQLAARFVEALETLPVAPAATALIAIARDSGYDADDLQALVAAVEQELLVRYGSAEIQLQTAYELPVAAIQELAAAVARQANLHTYSFTHRVDSQLLGGFEAQAGDTAIRASVRSQLRRLEATRG